MAEFTPLRRRTRRLTLDFMGEGWENAFVEVRRPSITDSLKVEEIMKRDETINGLLGVVKFLFEKGEGVAEDGTVIELTPEHLDTLDGEAILAMTSQVTLGEQTDPKASMNSEATTPEPETSPSDSLPSNTEPNSDFEPKTSSESPSKSSITGEPIEKSEPNS